MFDNDGIAPLFEKKSPARAGKALQLIESP